MPEKKLLPIRVCSPAKSAIARGYLWDIYTNSMLQAYFKATRYEGAILSRKNGISLPSLKHDSYSDAEQLLDQELLLLLRKQLPKFKGTILLYWNHRPLTHDKWVALLRKAGYEVEEYRTLPQLVTRFRGQQEPRARRKSVREPFVPAAKRLTDHDITRLASRIEKEFAFMEDRGAFAKLRDAKSLLQESEPFENLDPWLQRYMISQSMDPNVESNRTEAEAHQDVAQYTYALTSIRLGAFPVSYWEKQARVLLKHLAAGKLDGETRYMAVQVQRVFDLQRILDTSGFDKKQPIVVIGIVTGDGDPRFAVENGHHRLQALRNLAKANHGFSVNTLVPVVVMFRKDIHDYKKMLRPGGLIDVHHVLADLVKDAHWPTGEQAVPFTFIDGVKTQVMYLYMQRVPNALVVSLSFPSRNIPRLASAFEYVRSLNPHVSIFCKERYPRDKLFLQRLERMRLIDGVLEGP